MAHEELVDLLLDLPPMSVLRWTGAGRSTGTFGTYVALKVSDGQWYTTATEANPKVPQIIDTDLLGAELVFAGNAGRFEVASDWLEYTA